MKTDLLITHKNLQPLMMKTERNITNHISMNFEGENRLISAQQDHYNFLHK